MKKDVIFISDTGIEILSNIIKKNTTTTYISEGTKKYIRSKRTIPIRRKEKKPRVCNRKLIEKYSNIINRCKKILDKNKEDSKKLRKSLGAIKGICHNKYFSNKLEMYLERIIKKKFKTILWNTLRDTNRMKRYRNIHIICEWCKDKKSVHTHHVISPLKEGKETYSNYLAVCIECHSKFHPRIKNFIINSKGFLKKYYKKF